uniref:Neuferricin n=2 Tax=Aceria tosichella TaxID=561515 RepID=A0A6G1S450_9ACAR
MGFFSKSLLILLIAVSTPLVYRHYANDGTIKFMSQYYSNYKVIDQFLRQSASHLDQAKQYLPDSKQVKAAYEQLNKQFNAYVSSTATQKTDDADVPKAGEQKTSKPKVETPAPPTYRLSSCPGETQQVRLWTKDELIKFDGNSGEPDVLLGFLGSVYNVTLNGQHYGPGAEYNVFAGKDATRAFVTGNFTHDLTDQIGDIDESLYQHIESWASFYSSSYQEVGRIVGAFFDERGCATPELARVYHVIDQLAEAKNSQAEQDKQLPECNSEWNGELKQGRVWCSTKSGGFERDWVGTPRVYNDGQSQKCVCVNPNFNQQDGAPLSTYPGCDPEATECSLAQV